MPTYEYECKKGHTFEVVQSIKDKPLTKCTHIVQQDNTTDSGTPCGAKCKRIINFSGGVLWKGSGWTPKFYK